jgi:phosphoribosylamine--glycine ligase
MRGGLNVLVIGNGGREHAIALALNRDPGVCAVHVAPGNPGTAAIAENHPVEITSGAAVASLEHRLQADLVVVGPEAPLVAGVADAVRAAGIACFGPSAAAARIESSKDFAKQVMAAAGVPTAASTICARPDQVRAGMERFGPPYVIKNDGPAGGKGVVVTDDPQLAIDHAGRCDHVLVEEYLTGPEVSLFALCDGQTVLPMQPAQDFKRVGAGGTGPNTGGMGAYAPLPWAPEDLTNQVTDNVLQPVADELARRGTPFVGLLYAGLALTPRGVRVVEFNARFGDPETQPLLALLETPLAQLLHATATGRLADQPPLRWRPGSAVGVVLAAAGYPDAPQTGGKITGMESLHTPAIQAGTDRDENDNLISSGGRVLTVVGTGDDLTRAREQAYTDIAKINLDGSFYRPDIALAAAEGNAYAADPA